VSAPPPDAWSVAVVVAAGRGERFGDASKIMLPLAGRPMLAHVLDAIEGALLVRAVVLVAGEHTRPAVEDLVAEGGWAKPRAVVQGGPRRQDSVAAGLGATPADAPVVVVHDGARPLASARLFERCVEAALVHGAAIAAVPVSDTIKRVRDGLIAATVPRDDLWAAQTPQAFRRELLAAALVSPVAAETTFTDEAGLLEALGHPVAIVPGDRSNIKITVPDDLAVAEALLRGHLAEPPNPPAPFPPLTTGGRGRTAGVGGGIGDRPSLKAEG
jgi:2-C-methyl-D-erythritol 4-phosphate cytidylyltransferase